MRVEVRPRVQARPTGAVAEPTRPGRCSHSAPALSEAYQDACLESPIRFFIAAPEHPKLGQWARGCTLMKAMSTWQPSARHVPVAVRGDASTTSASKMNKNCHRASSSSGLRSYLAQQGTPSFTTQVGGALHRRAPENAWAAREWMSTSRTHFSPSSRRPNVFVNPTRSSWDAKLDRKESGIATMPPSAQVGAKEVVTVSRVLCVRRLHRSHVDPNEPRSD